MHAIVDSLVADAHEDYIGLWQIVSHVSQQDKIKGDEVIRAESLRVLRLLLKRGLVVGELKAGGGFDPWPVQDVEAVVDRVEMKWKRLGHTPDIGDICWLSEE